MVHRKGEISFPDSRFVHSGTGRQILAGVDRMAMDFKTFSQTQNGNEELIQQNPSIRDIKIQ
jgi:hypothetical protein